MLKICMQMGAVPLDAYTSQPNLEETSCQFTKLLVNCTLSITIVVQVVAIATEIYSYILSGHAKNELTIQ